MLVLVLRRMLLRIMMLLILKRSNRSIIISLITRGIRLYTIRRLHSTIVHRWLPHLPRRSWLLLLSRLRSLLHRGVELTVNIVEDMLHHFRRRNDHFIVVHLTWEIGSNHPARRGLSYWFSAGRAQKHVEVEE